MKKYIKPQTQVIAFDSTEVIATSGSMGKSSDSADPNQAVLQGSDRTSLWGED